MSGDGCLRLHYPRQINLSYLTSLQRQLAATLYSSNHSQAIGHKYLYTYMLPRGQSYKYKYAYYQAVKICIHFYYCI